MSALIVAKVIDIGSLSKRSGSHTIDVSGEDYGYIVDYRNHGQNNGRVVEHNWTLTLTGFKSSKVEIEFESFDLIGSYGECAGYLQINSLNQICKPPAGKITVDLASTAPKSINFNLVTNSPFNEYGFWLRYKGSL